MITSLTIAGYKQFGHLQLEGLGRMNILLGKNNVGKTTVLEGAFGLACGANPTPFFERVLLRLKAGYDQEIGLYQAVERMQTAFHRVEVPMSLMFSADTETGQRVSFSHTLTPNGAFSALSPVLSKAFGQGQDVLSTSVLGQWEVMAKEGEVSQHYSYPLQFPAVFATGTAPYRLARFVDLLAHRSNKEHVRIYGMLKREGMLEDFLSHFRAAFPEVAQLDAIPYPDGSPSPVYVRLQDGRYLPLQEFGDGFQHWYHVVGGMAAYPKAIHCIEEIGATMHYAAQASLGRQLLRYAQRYDNQVFASSHSIEFLDALLELLTEEELQQLRVVTLRQSDGQVRARVLTGAQARESRVLLSTELR